LLTLFTLHDAPYAALSFLPHLNKMEMDIQGYVPPVSRIFTP